MTDIIDAAKGNENRIGGSPEGTWIVTFVDGDTKAGTLRRLGSGNYVMESSGITYYFNADKVLRLYPET